MSNNTTQSNIVVGAALTGGLLFFGFLTNTCTSPVQKETSAKPAVSQTKNNDLAKLRQSYAESQKQSDKYQADLKLKNAKITELNKQLEAMLKAKPANDATSLELQLNKLSNNNAELKSNADRLKTELKEKSNNFESLIKELESKKSEQIAELRDDLKSLNNRRKQLANKLQMQTQEHQAEIQKLKAMQANAGVGDNKLQMKVHDLTSELELNMAKARNFEKQANAFRDLTTQQEAKITKLSAQVNQFKAQKNMFVKSTDDLPEKAKSLFDSLKALEGKSSDEVKNAYTQLAQQNKSEAKARVKFSSGKASLSAADKSKIAELINAADENAYFLIVGYADKSGNAAGNQKLSSQRATNVAKSLAEKAKGFQAAQAVYLGQTDRFGDPSENRVVEIWQIK